MSDARFEAQLDRELEKFNMGLRFGGGRSIVTVVFSAISTWIGCGRRNNASDCREIDNCLAFERKIPKKWQEVFGAYRVEALRRRAVFSATAKK